MEARIGVLVRIRRKIVEKEIYFKKTLSIRRERRIFGIEKQSLLLQKSSKETYHWSLRKVGLSMEGFGGEFEIEKIAFDLKI